VEIGIPNFHESWYGYISTQKKILYLFYNIAQRNIKKEIFQRFRVDIDISARLLANQRSELTNAIL
jgi:hypothetical protein